MKVKTYPLSTRRKRCGGFRCCRGFRVSFSQPRRDLTALASISRGEIAVSADGDLITAFLPICRVLAENSVIGSSVRMKRLKRAMARVANEENLCQQCYGMGKHVLVANLRLLRTWVQNCTVDFMPKNCLQYQSTH